MHDKRILPSLAQWICLTFALTVWTGGLLQSQARPDTLWGTPARVALWQDSLEQQAIRTRDGTVQATIISRLAWPGNTWGAVNDPPSGWVVYPGIVARMRRILPHASTQGLEAIVAMLEHQAERAEAISFLAELTMERRIGPSGFVMGTVAVGALSRMGPTGIARLQQIHASGEGPEVVRKQLDRLAQTGYRKPPAQGPPTI